MRVGYLESFNSIGDQTNNIYQMKKSFRENLTFVEKYIFSIPKILIWKYSCD